MLVITLGAGTTVLIVVSILLVLLLARKPDARRANEMARVPDSGVMPEVIAPEGSKLQSPDSPEPVEPVENVSERSRQNHQRPVEQEPQASSESPRVQGQPASPPRSSSGSANGPAHAGPGIRLILRPVLLAQTAPIVCLSLSPDGKTLVSGHADKSIRFINLSTESPTIRLSLFLLTEETSSKQMAA